MAYKRPFLSVWLMAVPTAVLLTLSLLLSLLFRYPHGISQHLLRSHLAAFGVVHIFWLLVFFIHSIFDVDILRRYTGIVFGLFSSMVVNIVLAALYFYIQPDLILTPRRFLILHAAISFVLILAWYLLIKWGIGRRFIQAVYFFSLAGELDELREEIKKHSYLGFQVRGFLNEGEDSEKAPEPNSIIILPDNLNTNPCMLAYFYSLRLSGTRFHNHRQFYESLFRRVYLRSLTEVWFLENIHYRRQKLYDILKRVLDLMFGVVLLVLCIITAPFLFLANKLTSDDPLFFIQERIGYRGVPFRMYKYRTMTGSEVRSWTAPNDFRITRVGRFLRRTGIDELPQCINLLRGEISLVGPRPEQVGIVEELRKLIPFYDERHMVKPGITGWAQLHTYAGSVEETRLKLQYDLYYIKHRSLLFDAEIILKTFYYLFTWSGR